MTPNNSEPVFKTILGAQWENLGAVIQKHYFLRAYSDDYICVEGVMSEVYHSAVAKLFLPFGLIFGALVPWQGKNVQVAVHYNASRRNGNIYWDRVLKFANNKVFHFKSHMEHIGDREVIEFVRFGVGMKLTVSAEEGAIVFRDKGYIWRLFGKDIPIPVQLILGKAYVEERPVTDNEFSMKMTLKHPWFGDLFRYSGRFSLPEG